MRWAKISRDRRISDWFNLKSHSLSLYVCLLALDLPPMPAAHLNQPPTNTNKCMTLWHYDREIFCCVSDDEIKSNSNWVFATWSSNKFWSGVPLCSHHKCDHLWSFLCRQLLLNFFHHQVSKPSSNCNKLLHCTTIIVLFVIWTRNDSETITQQYEQIYYCFESCEQHAWRWWDWTVDSCETWVGNSVPYAHHGYYTPLCHCSFVWMFQMCDRSCRRPTSHHDLLHWRQAYWYWQILLWTYLASSAALETSSSI
jgi:hypothetical protein